MQRANDIAPLHRQNARRTSGVRHGATGARSDTLQKWLPFVGGVRPAGYVALLVIEKPGAMSGVSLAPSLPAIEHDDDDDDDGDCDDEHQRG